MTNLLKTYGAYVTAALAIIYALIGFFDLHTLTAADTIKIILGGLGLSGLNATVNVVGAQILITLLNALGAELPPNATKTDISVAVSRARSRALTATKKTAPLWIVGLLLIVSAPGLSACGVLGGTTGGVTAQDLSNLNTGGTVVKATMDFTIGNCIKSSVLQAACAAVKGPVKAAAQGVTTLFDQAVIVANNGGTSSALGALLLGIGTDIASYEQIVTDLHTTALKQSGKKAISVMDIITIASTSIPVIEEIYNAFAGAQSNAAVTPAQLTALGVAIDADNAAIQAW